MQKLQNISFPEKILVCLIFFYVIELTDDSAEQLGPVVQN